MVRFSLLLLLPILLILASARFISEINSQHHQTLEAVRLELNSEIEVLNQNLDKADKLIETLAGDLLIKARSEFQALIELYNFNLPQSEQICSRFMSEREDTYKINRWRPEEKKILEDDIENAKKSIIALQRRANDTDLGLRIKIQSIRLASGIEQPAKVWAWIELHDSRTNTSLEKQIHLEHKGDGQYSSQTDLDLLFQSWTPETVITLSLKDGPKPWPFRPSPNVLAEPVTIDLYSLQPAVSPWEEGGWIIWPENGYKLRIDGHFP